MTVIDKLAGRLRPLIRGAEFLSPVADLAIRLWVANVFWKSGLTKIQSWESTRFLFKHEYQVPLIPSDVAAVLGTTTELAFPVLLAIGLAARLSAGVLFVFNIIAVLSYPGLNEAGILQHQLWGVMLLVPLLHGPGKLSIDHYLRRRYLGTA